MGHAQALPGRLSRVTAPPDEPVSLTEAKAHLRVTHSDDDTLIGSLITAAREHIDGADGILSRCLVQQTWDYKIDEFPLANERIVLPLAPVLTVDSVSYVDLNGSTQTLASSVYQVVNGGTRRSWIEEAYGQSWPATRDIRDAVTIRFTAGYDDDGASPPGYAANVPEPLKAAILLIIGDLYENREGRNVAVSSEDNPTVQRLLKPYQVNWF